MKEVDLTREAALARTVVAEATASQRAALLLWAQELLAIRESEVSSVTKARRAIVASSKWDVLIPLLKRLSLELKLAGYESKKLLWDQRSWPTRLALTGVALGTAAFRGRAAGLAALGSAVRVPLWLVGGAGGAFIGTLIEEISRLTQPPNNELQRTKPAQATELRR